MGHLGALLNRKEKEEKSSDQTSRWRHICAWGSLDSGVSLNVSDSSFLEQTYPTFSVQDRLQVGIGGPCLEPTKCVGSMLPLCRPAHGPGQPAGLW